MNYTRIDQLNQSLAIFKNFSDLILLLNENNTFKFKNETAISKLRPGDIIPIMITANFSGDAGNSSQSLQIEI